MLTYLPMFLKIIEKKLIVMVLSIFADSTGVLKIANDLMSIQLLVIVKI